MGPFVYFYLKTEVYSNTGEAEKGGYSGGISLLLKLMKKFEVLKHSSITNMSINKNIKNKLFNSTNIKRIKIGTAKLMSAVLTAKKVMVELLL